jgi:hypothetical protein
LLGHEIPHGEQLAAVSFRLQFLDLLLGLLFQLEPPVVAGVREAREAVIVIPQADAVAVRGGPVGLVEDVLVCCNWRHCVLLVYDWQWGDM